MYVEIETKRLAFALECARRAAGAKSDMPVLKCAELSVQPSGALTVRATDLAAEARVTVGTEHVGGPCYDAIVDVASALKIVKSAKGDTVSIFVQESAGNVVEISTGRTKYKLTAPGIATVDDMPTRRDVPPEGLALEEVDAERFTNALEFCARAMSGDGERPHLNGMLLAPRRGKLVGVDGHRLHMAEIGPLDGDHDAIIGPAAVALLRWTLGKVKGASVSVATHPKNDNEYVPTAFRVEGYVGKNGGTFQVTVEISARAVEARFPPYDKVIPCGVDNMVDLWIDGAAVAEAVRDVAVVASPAQGSSIAGPAVKLRLNQERAEIYADSPDDGEATADAGVTMAVDTCPADGFEIGVNGNYLIDVVGALPKSLQKEQVHFRCTGPSDAMLITIDDFAAVVMPLRT